MTLLRTRRQPLTLQARLMAAVIGFVSVILIIVALITSATLGQTLEAQLATQVRDMAPQIRKLIDSAVVSAARSNRLGSLTAADTFEGVGAPPASSMLVVMNVPKGEVSGILLTSTGPVVLDEEQLSSVTEISYSEEQVTISVPGLGSYLVQAGTADSGARFVSGISRAEVQGTMAKLLTVITLATIGGLILLALTTMVTIRIGLRPLRAVAVTATRVANLPLDRGEVSITERVPDAEADPRTETGLVGAALNKLLDHVDTSLSVRQRNEEKMRRFVADASHELRTPLASIRGYSELSLRALNTGSVENTTTALETTASSLERIQAQSLRMTRLVEDLLLLARLDEGRELVYGSVDLTQLALESLADAQPTAPEHRWNIDVPDEPVIVLGDAGRLHQVVTNLLANARTHTPVGTVITLSVEREKATALLRVNDNGPGIDPVVREQLFSRFARGDASRARRTGGTGLGLAIAKAIVEGHGGGIDVDSVPGSTTFTVRLPMTPPLAAPPPSEPSDEAN